MIKKGQTLSPDDPPNVVVSARKADGAPPRQGTQHRMWSETKE